ncbi:hypothetical protein, variant 4 [Aphanomyces astaci]|uniref:Rab-GAP TBC domain-containing protein n=1 Tax=Aphanomyces astaci TaxID=112090 RepID=W4G891_APHAT|nr:hypothetical protein, variant 3 [Aphanomyces astaci]XP_009834537.1 hypothetical protein, variant 4 [Aphanomyces astaci]ETV75894.1 hypothetical protein, variant 3 [Aphanomyces astaci]ETV75895.1 hypothetical protein, variant 4 [Aphanomyces astaci]|eukprot:XP_009834534.1 hypothetical protein, variant 3 [Aphanomyces astaci]
MIDVQRGFRAIRDVRVIGFYSAKDIRSDKHYVVYVIEVTLDPSMSTASSSSSFLVYRRYSQIAILSTKLHFETSVGLPPKYALQPYPLSDEQLAHRYDGLRHFVEEIFAELKRRCDDIHDDSGAPSSITSRRDIQIFSEFLHLHKNRPPPPAHPPLADWAHPGDFLLSSDRSGVSSSRFSSISSESLSTLGWGDGGDGFHENIVHEEIEEEEQGGRHVRDDITTTTQLDLSNYLRNDVLQVESQCHALWNVVQAYVQAAQTLSQATETVQVEMTRLSKMNLLVPAAAQPDPGSTASEDSSPAPLLPPLPSALNFSMERWKHLEQTCGQDVVAPIRHLCHDVLPEVKATYWGSNAPVLYPACRYRQERAAMQTSLQSTLAAVSAAFRAAAIEFLTPCPTVKTEPATQCNEDMTSPHCDIVATAIDATCTKNDGPTVAFAVPQVYVWGRLPDATTPLLRPTPQPIKIGQDIAQVACGGDRVLFLTGSGEVYSYNPDEKGQSLDSPQLVEQFALDKALHRSVVVSVACGPQHALAITHVGELYSWGSGEDGRLGHGDVRDRPVPRKVMSLLGERVVQGSCGGAHTAVVTASHQLFTFGRGKHGRLGLGSTALLLQTTPTAIPSTMTWQRVCCGWNFTVALTMSGQVLSWGKQAEGQCGLGYIEADQWTPVPVDALRPYTIADVACGYTHTLAVSDAGELFSWGLGEYGQLGKETIYQPVPQLVDVSTCLAMDRVLHVYCGAFHSVATTQHNVLLTWGLNVYGACGLGHTTNKDAPERLDCFDRGHELVVVCGHKFTMVLERATGSHVESRMGAQSTGSLQKEEDLRRTKRLWRTRILKNWDASRDSPLAQTLWRQGIPPSLRSKVWPLAIGNSLKITPAMYHLYRQRASQARLGNVQVPLDGREHTVKLIHTDLPRTFPTLKLFDTSGPYFDYLREVLETYACYRPDLGYIQGMSYIAALLCLHIPTDRYLTFQCLANVMVHEHLFTFYLLDVDLASV